MRDICNKKIYWELSKSLTPVSLLVRNIKYKSQKQQEVVLVDTEATYLIICGRSGNFSEQYNYFDGW